MGRIIDTLRRAEADGKTVVSFEVFPAKTPAGESNLLARIEAMVLALRPAFVSLTWRATFKDEDVWLSLGSRVQRDFHVDVLMHLTCHLPVPNLKRILARARAAGIRNILALRGDAPAGAADKWRPVPGGLAHAVDLVRLIRAEHGDHFCVAVAGYPEVHGDCWNHPALPPSEQARELDLLRLKAKVDAGADFVITQFFLDGAVFSDFSRRAAAAGIKVPIIPGYMPLQSYEAYSKFTAWSRTRVPPGVRSDLERIKDDDAAVKAYGVALAVDTLRPLLASGSPPPTGGPHAVHLYTMNLQFSVQRVLERLELVPRGPARAMPWGSGPTHPGEESRPIFWANRAASYLARTARTTGGGAAADFDAYPNGRFSLSASPAFGELSEYYLAARKPKPDRRSLWGTPASFDDVKRVFVGFLDGGVPSLPWCDEAPAPETSTVYQQLRWLNRAGFLTINSQPRVNGAPSDDKLFGWGGPDGVVFQKAYVEFFVPDALFRRLLEAFPRYPSLTYHALRAAGDEEYHNGRPGHATAVTWGVWPGREVMQPTVVDPAAFRVWRTEAFELWTTHWGSVYDGDGDADATARRVIAECQSGLWLVSVVDNEYVKPGADIFAIFRDVVRSGMSEADLRGRLVELEEENAGLHAQATRLKEAHANAEGELARALERLRAEEAASATLRLQLRELEARTTLRVPPAAVAAVASAPAGAAQAQRVAAAAAALAHRQQQSQVA